MPRSARSSGNAWLALRRPLAVAISIGCAISLFATGTVTLRLALPAALYWSFVPLVQIAGLIAALRGRARAEEIDSFFASYTPWLLWLAAFSALWTFVPAPIAFAKTGYPSVWYAAAALAACWTAWRDFTYFRRAGRPPAAAARDLLVQRAVSWGLGMAIFVPMAGWQAVAARLGI